jgi:hypothetical protein
MNILDRITLALTGGKYSFFPIQNSTIGRDGAGIQGRFKLRVVRGPTGMFGAPGEVWESPWIKNIITKTGVAVISGLAGNVDSQTAFTKMELGHDSTAAANTQTILGTYIAATNACGRAACTVTRETTDETNDTLQLEHTWTASAAETDIEEVGVFSEATVNVGPMLARQTFTAINLAASDTLKITYQIKFAGSTW